MTRRPEIVAAASRYTQRKLRPRAVDQSWQTTAWGFYKTTPEVRFAARWTGNAMSGALLYAGFRNEQGLIERAPDGHRATEIVNQIAGGPDGQAQLLGRFGPHLTVAGEGWIVVRPVLDGTNTAVGEDWRVLSVREVQQQSSKLVAQIDGFPVEIPGDPENGTPDPNSPVAIRVWDEHPENHQEADSPVRSSLGTLEEMHLLNAAVKAIARSRLTGRGIILVPKGTRFPGTPVQGNAEDDLIDVFMEVAETAYKEPESAAATVPIILEVPAEMIGDIKRLTFESDFDSLAKELREECIRRFATGLEMPAEILLGMGNVNHWGVWQLSQEAIRLAIEPRLGIVAHAFTTQWLRPILEAERVPDWHRWMCWYDTAPLRVRTNRSETAIKVFELGAISGKALRRETGFDEDDAPTAAEQAERDRTDDENPDEEGLPVDETTSEPDTLPASALPPVSDGLLAATDGLIWAALSAAGRKLERTPACPRSERARAREVEPAQLHTLLSIEAPQVEQWRLLDGAWNRAPEIAKRYGLDPDCLTDTLDAYARELIAAGVPHVYETTAGVLRSPCLLAAA
ncbi:hypothetical protein ABT358_02430 [Streptomyces sp. NPDC000341]|uniref:hypothetical protein n=1 Tax=Streptomyces sp. NPDC000341 TaxID=3156645 RepID=UPI003333837B